MDFVVSKARVVFGQVYSVKPAPGTKVPFTVQYEAQDEDTPVITVTDSNGWKHELTDVEAEELARQLNHALRRLPSSK